MRVITWNLILATWLMASAFALSHSPVSMMITFVAGLAMGLASLASGGKPGVRYLISAISLLLVAAMFVLPDVHAAGRINNIVVGAVLFALSIISPQHARSQEHDEPHAAAH